MLQEPRVGSCALCHRLTRRTERVWQYLTSLNKNAAGVPKTEAEVLAELQVELASRLAKPVVCRGCEGRAES